MKLLAKAKMHPKEIPEELTTHIGIIQRLIEIKRELELVNNAMYDLDNELGDCPQLYDLEDEINAAIGAILFAGHRDGIVGFNLPEKAVLP